MLLFFFNDTATTEIYTLSLHDALPISLTNSGRPRERGTGDVDPAIRRRFRTGRTPAIASFANHPAPTDRKSTRLNSSHANISYAVFCLKKKKIPNQHHTTLCSRQFLHT